MTADHLTHDDELREQLDDYLEEYRSALHDSLDELTEEEARRSLVPSVTTLLGLVKHVTWVERVWYDQAVTGRTRAELGIVESPDASFRLADDDTVASIQAGHRDACVASREAVRRLPLDHVLTGRGPRPLWRIHLHVVRELAQHAGHADILRE